MLVSLWIGHTRTRRKRSPDQPQSRGHSRQIRCFSAKPTTQGHDQNDQCQRIEDIEDGVPKYQKTGALLNKADDGIAVDSVRTKAERRQYSNEKRKSK